MNFVRFGILSMAVAVFGLAPSVQAASVKPAIDVYSSVTTPIAQDTGLYTDSTEHTVGLPSTVVAGDLMIVILTFDGAPLISPPAGWTEAWTTSASTVVTSAGYYRIATSTNESRTSVTFTTNVAEQGAAQLYKISNWSGSVSDIAVGNPITSTASSPAGATATLPSLTPSWDGGDSIWIAAVSTSTSRTVTSGPDGYSSVYQTRSGDTTAAAQVGTAYRMTSTLTEDPGEFIFSGAGVSSVAQTIAINSGPAVDSNRILEHYNITRSGSTMYVPVYASQPMAVADPSVRRAIISIHGASVNSERYIDHVRLAVAPAEGVLTIAPQFAESTSNAAINQLFWSTGWRQCNRSSAALAWRISSCEVLDEMIASLNATFPNLESVVVAGFSAGGQAVNRYAATQQPTADIRTRYVVGSPSSFMYLSAERPDGGGGFSLPVTSCTGYNFYRYGLEGLSATAYVNNVGAAALTSNYIDNHVTYLVGGNDNDPGDSSLDTSCEATLQGVHRLERMQNFYTHLGYHLGGDVYERHKMEVVPGVAHNARETYGLTWQGKAALLRGYTMGLPVQLTQQRSDNSTIPVGESTATDNKVTLGAKSVIKDPMSTGVKFYFEVRSMNSPFVAPFNPSAAACQPSVMWQDCDSKVWKVDSTEDTAALNGIAGSVTVSGLTYDTGYRWQVIACDSDYVCSDWSKQNGNQLSFRTKTAPMLTVGFVDESNQPVLSPQFSFDGTSARADCQTTSGQFADASQRLRIVNSLTDTGWVVSVAATQGSQATWERSDNAQSYSYNSPAGCGIDDESPGGQLSFNPGVGTVSGVGDCSTDGLTLGGGASFARGGVSAITLLSASTAAESDCSWDITGVAMTQAIPGGQAPGLYTIDMTVSIVAQ